MLHYNYTILYVDNVAETLGFYTKAFGLKQKLLTPEGDYGELETGNTTLAFASFGVAEYNGITVTNTSPEEGAPAFEITFVSDSIEKDFEQAIQSGAILIKAPEQKPWGQIVGYIKDINGFLVEICTRIEM